MPDPQSRLTFSLADYITPAEFAEILAALETIHRELTGEPLRDLMVRIGETMNDLPETDHEIITPTTEPDHPTVGKRFKAWNGLTYYCDSYDRRIGFWMTPIDPETDEPRANVVSLGEDGYWQADEGSRRKNVSERAIGRTFHRVWGRYA